MSSARSRFVTGCKPSPPANRRRPVDMRARHSRQALLNLEGQAQFGNILRPRKGSAGQLLDTPKAVPHGVGMAKDLLSGVVSGPPSVEPRLERVEQDRAFRGRQFV